MSPPPLTTPHVKRERKDSRKFHRIRCLLGGIHFEIDAEYTVLNAAADILHGQ